MIASAATTWNLEPLQLAPTLVVGLLYYRRSRTLARRGTPVPGWRQFLFWLGIALVIVALNSPVDALGEQDFFFVHMGQHVILGDLAPLCFVAGLTGPILRPVLAIKTVDRLRFLTHPLVALPVWAVNLYIWHVPFMYQAALRHAPVHALEHFLFFTCGALMWSPVVETLPAPAWFGTGWKLGYIVAVRFIETILGERLHLVVVGLLPLVRPRARDVGDHRRPRPEPRRDRDDGRGRARDARRARVALPAARRGRRAEAEADRGGLRPGPGRPGRPLRAGEGASRRRSRRSLTRVTARDGTVSRRAV